MKILQLKKWDESINPAGYWMSEKLDGYRAYWDGKRLLSRNGNVINCPKEFTESFPDFALDGEIWAGRNNYEIVGSVVKGRYAQDWNKVSYQVFDAPDANGTFEDRLRFLDINNVKYIPHERCKDKTSLLIKLNQIVSAGGEGMVLRKAGSRYERKRSDAALKVKIQHDDEAVVIGYEDGNRKGLVGALRVINSKEVVFKVGSGMSESMVRNPPPIGAVITYKYESLTTEGVPRPATFVRVRE
jgi:DNA ligase 1